LLLVSGHGVASIPATEVMVLYQFNGPLDLPYYRIEDIGKAGRPKVAGTLAQGTSVIPCLAMRNGRPVTDRKGTPFVGFDVVVDAGKATPESVAVFKRAVAQRRAMRVNNHHCGKGVRYVLNVRKLYRKTAGALFVPPMTRTGVKSKTSGQLDTIIHAFHNSGGCNTVNRRLTGRRDALAKAWAGFIAKHRGQWPDSALKHARRLDYTLRTAIFEGHLGRGCNAYGACERNTIALTIRNRARGSCLKRQGCAFPGDYQGAASKVNQYNIWDEYLTQISGLTACFLRDDLATDPYYHKLQRMYAQSQPDVERILFGTDRDLQAIFSGNSLKDLKRLRHYYHAPAMGKCFPDHPRVEYMSGAIARKGGNYALIANIRIEVGQAVDGGYRFKRFEVNESEDVDTTKVSDDYRGFVVDGRKVRLKRPHRCAPYGIPKGCRMDSIGRYRKTPSWLTAGKPLALNCRIRDQGEQCATPARLNKVTVGGRCDVEMRPVTGVH
jgi:hypothetical protein